MVQLSKSLFVISALLSAAFAVPNVKRSDTTVVSDMEILGKNFGYINDTLTSFSQDSTPTTAQELHQCFLNLESSAQTAISDTDANQQLAESNAVLIKDHLEVTAIVVYEICDQLIDLRGSFEELPIPGSVTLVRKDLSKTHACLANLLQALIAKFPSDQATPLTLIMTSMNKYLREATEAYSG